MGPVFFQTYECAHSTNCGEAYSENNKLSHLACLFAQPLPCGKDYIERLCAPFPHLESAQKSGAVLG